jgi:hypothetical protein
MMVVTTDTSPTKMADLSRHVFPSESMTMQHHDPPTNFTASQPKRYCRPRHSLTAVLVGGGNVHAPLFGCSTALSAVPARVPLRNV